MHQPSSGGKMKLVVVVVVRIDFMVLPPSSSQLNNSIHIFMSFNFINFFQWIYITSIINKLTAHCLSTIFRMFIIKLRWIEHNSFYLKDHNKRLIFVTKWLGLKERARAISINVIRYSPFMYVNLSTHFLIILNVFILYNT